MALHYYEREADTEQVSEDREQMTEDRKRHKETSIKRPVAICEVKS